MHRICDCRGKKQLKRLDFVDKTFVYRENKRHSFGSSFQCSQRLLSSLKVLFCLWEDTKHFKKQVGCSQGSVSCQRRRQKQHECSTQNKGSQLSTVHIEDSGRVLPVVSYGGETSTKSQPTRFTPRHPRTISSP